MLTEKQYKKIERKLQFKLCPACGCQLFDFNGETSNLFGSITSYREIDENKTNFLSTECRGCGLVFNFNLKILIQ